jgi:hypothetical protein
MLAIGSKRHAIHVPSQQTISFFGFLEVPAALPAALSAIVVIGLQLGRGRNPFLLAMIHVERGRKAAQGDMLWWKAANGRELRKYEDRKENAGRCVVAIKY